MKRTISIILCVVILLSALGVGAVFIFRPAGLKGSADVYNTVTVQLKDNLFYDVHVPVEAALQSTDGATLYAYDTITVGVQDTEPSSFCKVQVGGRWVFATSEDGWLKATQAGFESEVPYEGTYSVDTTKWIDTIPSVVVDLDQELLTDLADGASHLFGEREFITSQVAYGTFDVAVERALVKMSSLYKQPINYGLQTEDQLWVTSNQYTIAVTPINYNTCLVVAAYGEQGKQYAAKLMGAGSHEG